MVFAACTALQVAAMGPPFRVRPLPGRSPLTELSRALCSPQIHCVFLLTGIANVVMLPAPIWFSALDLSLAYVPAGWFGHRVVARRR